jgi:hypothetical protein
VLPPTNVAKATEVIREKFALRFWKIKLRKIFLHGPGNVNNDVHLT